MTRPPAVNLMLLNPQACLAHGKRDKHTQIRKLCNTHFLKVSHIQLQVHNSAAMSNLETVHDNVTVCVFMTHA